ncbi:hypothetical protein PWW31_19105 [Vibrio harveyi]|nr:hypothetical protein PWW31_19105 [Vibrio harveyi]
MKRTTLSITLLSTVMLLAGCGDESNQASNVATTQSVEKEPTQKACYDVGETTSLDRKDVTGPRCQWQSEHNFIVYSEDLSKPEYLGTLPVKPGYAVRRAKEYFVKTCLMRALMTNLEFSFGGIMSAHETLS